MRRKNRKKGWKTKSGANTKEAYWSNKCDMQKCPHMDKSEGCMLLRNFRICPDYHVAGKPNHVRGKIIKTTEESDG